MTLHQSLAEWSSWLWPFLANHLWQSTLLAIAAFGFAALLKNAPGRARYAIWLIASAKFVVPSALLVSLAHWFGLSFSSLFASHPETGNGFTIISQLTSPVIELEQSASRQTVAASNHSELFCVLSLVWFIGCAFLIGSWWSRRRRLSSALRFAPESAAVRETLALGRVHSWLGVRQNVALSVLPGEIEPGVWGVWRPVVLLPESMAAELTEAELETVMMHELIHVQRRDNLAANLHRLLCCILWFHPIVWVLDRLLLVEREHACDEEVVRLGGAPVVYASSLVKVLRFCLGWSVAGASNATGSNLGRRVERIMSGKVQVRLSLWHRAAVGSIAALVLTLSLTAGVLRGGAVVKSNGLSNGVVGVAGADTGFAIDPGQDKLIERLAAAPLTAIDFKNSAKCPLTITDARVKEVPRIQNEPGDEFAVVPVISIVNNSERRIKGYALEFRNGLERKAYYERIPMLDRRGMHTSGDQPRFIILVGGANGWTVRVAGVLFEDDEVWGLVPPPPPPPPPPPSPAPLSSEIMRQLQEAPEGQIQADTSQDAPLMITSASARSFRTDRTDPDGTPQYLLLPNITLMNKTGKRVIAFGFELRDLDSRRSTYIERARVTIEPSSSYSFHGFGSNGSLTPVSINVSPDRVVARVVGVMFEGGEAWGSFRGQFAPPPPPQQTEAAESPKLIRKSGAVMMGSATYRVDAEYPALAQTANVSGSVVVEVTVDEAGSVTSVRAISGHPLLKDAAVTAARQWKFAPTMLSGVPTRVIGFLTFNFEL